MALQVWLPLTGNLKNLGLSDVEIPNVTLLYDATGKIGKAFTLKTSPQLYFIEPSLVDAQIFSFAFWYKPISDSSITANWCNLFRLGDINTEGTAGTLRVQSSYGSVSSQYVISIHNNTSYGIASVGYAFTNEWDKWHHIAFTCDGNECKGYLNGTLVKTDTFNSGKLSGKIWVGADSGRVNGLMNDLRIYDHALSQKEVKLLSQGLVAHYPLNDGIGGANLIANSWEMPNQVFNGYALADYSFTEHLVSGQKYTITARIRMSEDKKSVLCYHSGGSYNMGYWAVRKGEDDIYSWTFTATDAMASQTSKLGYGYLRIYVSNNQGTQGSTPITGSAYCHWIKIEKGEKSTPWVPNKQDALYSALGLDDGVVHDCSGYGCNARMIGTPIVFNDPPRYSVCQSFTNDVNTRYIRDIYTLRGLTMNEVSVSIWFKTNTINDSLSGDGGNFYSFGYNNGLRVRIPKSNGAVIWVYSHLSAAQFTYSSSLADDKWHHLVIVFDNGLMLCYIDGSQIESAVTKSSTTITFADNEYYRIATAQNGSEHFIGSLSDLRIYATALSAEDIADLYKTTASIDDHNNIFGYELQEINKVPYRQLINLDGLKSIGSYSGTLSKESDGVHLDGQVLATDSYANNGREGCIDVDPDNNRYLLSCTFSNTVGNRFYIGIERFDNNYTSTSNSSCIYPVNTQNATTRLSSAQFIDISKDANNNPVKHIKLRILNRWTGSSEDTVGSVIIHKLTLIEIPKN